MIKFTGFIPFKSADHTPIDQDMPNLLRRFIPIALSLVAGVCVASPSGADDEPPPPMDPATAVLLRPSGAVPSLETLDEDHYRVRETPLLRPKAAKSAGRVPSSRPDN